MDSLSRRRRQRLRRLVLLRATGGTPAVMRSLPVATTGSATESRPGTGA